MKYSQLIGIVISLLIVAAGFIPWAFIASHNWMLTGMDTMGTHYGKPALLHFFFATLAIVFFSIQKLWSKRANIFTCALNIAWAFKNFLLMSTCSGGDCPEKKIGIYIVLIGSFVMFVMACLPKIPIKDEE